MSTISDNYTAGDNTQAQHPECFELNSSGMVLVVVVILAAVAGILAAGLYFASSASINQVRQEVCFEKAFFVAEAGIEHAKAELQNRATNLTSVLIGSDGVSNTADDGVLSFGSPTNYGDGRFYVKVRNNTTNDPNPFVDTDHIVIIRSTGIVETATRVIEAQVQVIPPIAFTSMPQNAKSALGIYGTNDTLSVNGNATIDGHNYNVPITFDPNGKTDYENIAKSTNAAIPGVLYDSIGTVISLGGSGSIVGNPPTTNATGGVQNETYWYQFLNSIIPIAILYDGTHLGTRAASIITLLPSGLTTISGNVAGAGILIIPGDATVNISGTIYYEGLVMLLGNGIVNAINNPDFSDSGTASIVGAMICLGGDLNIKATGTANIYYSTQALANLANITNLPPASPVQMNTIYWKEIKASSTNW